MTSKPKNTLELYSNILLRKYIWYSDAKRKKYYLVTEFPKSGGTWYCKMLADYLSVPFARNISRPALKDSVVHGHQSYRKYNDLMSMVIRDGRDVMVSFYFHHLFYSDWNHHPAVDKRRKKLGFNDFDDIENNLPVFIEYISTDWANNGNFAWGTFNNEWASNLPADRIVKYEDLLTDCLSTMTRVLFSLTAEEIDQERLKGIVENNSFEKMTGRKRGDESTNSFARKGIAGDWKNKFNQSAADVFCELFGDDLIKFGYEVDKNWVNDISL